MGHPYPYVMGIIGTRSLTEVIPGIDRLVEERGEKIRSGLIAYDALMTIRQDREDTDPAVMEQFEEHGADLGYAFLLRRYLDDPREATEEQIDQAAVDTIPHVWPIFWSFRLMVGLGMGFLMLTAYFFWRSSVRGGRYPRLALWTAVFAIPLPWVAAELGWIVAEYGRQPWTVAGVLLTVMSVSELSVTELLLTLTGFSLLYTVLFVIEVKLLLMLIRKGPYDDVTPTNDWQRMHKARLMPGE